MGWEWLIVMIVMAIFGLLGQWLEAQKREQARGGRQRRRPAPQPVDRPESIDDLLRDILAREAPPAKEPAKPSPPAGRPVPGTPQPPGTRAPRRRRRPTAARRPKSAPPQAKPVPTMAEVKEAVRVDTAELLAGFREAGQKDLSGAFPAGEDLGRRRPVVSGELLAGIARDVRRQLFAPDKRPLIQAIVLYELLRPPVCVRDHALPALRPLPTPLLPPPAASEGWL